MEPTANKMVAKSFAGQWLGRVCVAHLLAAGLFVVLVPQSGMALELSDEPATIANELVTGDEFPIGEDVGEPAEDAPVEGEPRAGEAPELPGDDALDAPPDAAAEPGDEPASDLSGSD
jgi:hypothetical protein